MRSTLLLMLLALLLAPFASAGLTVPGGYVSTAPLVVDDHVLIRSSGTFDGTTPPMVRAYGEGGAVNWVIEGRATIQPDMAELVIMPAGTSDCGAWPEQVIIAWSSGLLEARSPDEGLALWQANTSIQGWGLTANPVVVDEGLLITTRSGIELRCPSNGALLHAAETGLGWRNPAVMVNGTAHVGDESGRLWSWTPGEAPSFIELDGTIRHAPLAINGGLLVHLQTQGSSLIQWLPLGEDQRPSAPSQPHRLASGASPGMPLALNATTAAVADASGVQVLTWAEDGWATSRLSSAPVQGPLRVDSGWLTGSVNAQAGGFFAFAVHDGSSELVFNTDLAGYGTAPPVGCGDAWLLVKDEGHVVLDSLSEDASCPLLGATSTVVDEAPVDKSPIVWTLALMVAFLAGSAAFYRRGPMHALRWSSPFVLIALVALMPALMGWWADQAPQTEGETLWDDTWPEAWQDGQVVVFELPNETFAMGGLEPRPSALEATVAAADELGLSLDTEDHALGTWVTAINGTTADGWIFEVNGIRPMVGPGAYPLPSSSVLVWRLA